MNQKLVTTLIWTGLILIVVGIGLPFFTGPQDSLYKYIFSVGAGLNFIGRIFNRYEGKNIRIKRLFRIEAWSGLFFCVGAFFMFYDPDPRNWIVFVLAGGALMAYTSLMIPHVQKKDNGTP